MIDISQDLWNAYLATSFRAETPLGSVSIRIGQLTPQLDKLLRFEANDSWAFITACNPFSNELSDTENARRHQQLVRRVAELGYVVFEGAGVPDATDWQPEPSLLILGIVADEAIQLGKEFMQNAVVVGGRGQRAELVSCR